MQIYSKISSNRLLWQLTFKEKQFNYEDEVIKCLIAGPIESPDQLKIILPDLCKLLSAILKTDIVNDQVSLGIDYKSGVNEYVSKIYLTSLPDSIQGLTLFNRCVVIKKKCNALEFEQEPVLRGFTLMTALHEYGHFAQRFYLTSDIQWLNHASPEYKRTKLHEAGTVLMTKIFGYEPVAINIKASEFLFDIKNWKLKLKDFQNQFKKLNDNIATDLIMNQRTARSRLRDSGTHFISLVGCSKSDWSRSEKI